MTNFDDEADAPCNNEEKATRKIGSRAWFLTIAVLFIQWTSLSSFLVHDEKIKVKSDSKQSLPFNPFRDLTLEPSAESNAKRPIYSTHRCVEPSESPFAPFVSRTCLFYNLYFQPSDKSFHYFASPAEASAFTKDELEQMLATANGYIHNDALERAQRNGDDYSKENKVQFTPVIHHNEEFPPLSSIAKIKTPSDPIFVLYRPSYSFNFGHFLWDDAMGVFTMLDFFGLTDVDSNQQQKHQHIPVHMDQGDDPFYRCSRKLRWETCIKMLHKTMPKLMGIGTDTESEGGGDILRVGNLFESYYNETIHGRNLSELVHLPKVITGPGRNAHFGCKGECTIHRTGRYYRFRQWLFQNIFGVSQGNQLNQMPASPNKITISLPVGNSHKPEEIQTFEAVLPALIDRYGSENVNAVDMGNLTVEEQAIMAASSNVYLSNNGGGSATSFFLQKGSSVLLFHVDGLRRDIELYSTVGYLNVDWLPVTAPVERVLKYVERALAQPTDYR